MFTLIFALLICVVTVAACESIRWYLRRMMVADTDVRASGIPAEADLQLG